MNAKPIDRPTEDKVKKFWNENPLCAAAIPYPVGTQEYFEYFNKLREAEEPSDFLNRLHEFKNFAGRLVLDVGSGNGFVLSKYAAEGAEVYGVDITETGIELCKKRFAIMNLKGNFKVANAEQLPFEDETFDCVCSMGVLHHTPNTEKAVAEIHRVLKKGGKLIVMFYHRNSVWYRIGMSIASVRSGKSLQQLVNEVDGIGNPKGCVYSKKELSHLLSEFSQLEMFTGRIAGWMILPRLGPLLFPHLLLKPFERWFGWYLYAKGIKPLNSTF